MKTLLSSLQWFIFILIGAIVAPIVIGDVFGLSQTEIASFLQRTIFITGCATLLQTLFGHRLPIAEGPAGLWWGTFIVYANLAASHALSTDSALRQLEATMLLSGLFFIIIGLFKLVKPIKKLFTPLVTGTFLLLLTAQLGSSFVKGMLGVGYVSDKVEAKIALPALVVLLITILFSRAHIIFIRRYSILLSLLIGWLLFFVLHLTKPIEKHAAFFAFPEIFAFGKPEFTSGTVITAVMLTMLLLTNMIASINVVERTVAKQKPINYNQSSFIAGINQSLSGFFAGVAPVPLSVTAGFLLTTKTFEKLPFLLANVGVILLSFFPSIISIFANIPSPVGYAVMFITIASLAALGIQSFQSLALTERQLFTISISFMIGIGSMFIPTESITHMPNYIMILMNNGLILGTITCICMEQIFQLLKARRNHADEA